MYTIYMTGYVLNSIDTATFTSLVFRTRCPHLSYMSAAFPSTTA